MLNVQDLETLLFWATIIIAVFGLTVAYLVIATFRLGYKDECEYEFLVLIMGFMIVGCVLNLQLVLVVILILQSEGCYYCSTMAQQLKYFADKVLIWSGGFWNCKTSSKRVWRLRSVPILHEWTKEIHTSFPISIVEVKHFMMIRVLWRCFIVLMIGKLNTIVC